MKIGFMLLASLVLLICCSLVTVLSIEDDVTCLQGIKRSLQDPYGRISWSFTNTTERAICKLNGVACWNDKENRIISLTLTTMQLSGQLPDSLQFCHSLKTLDLSANSLSGSIPTDLCKWLPYIVQLDLSNNRFSGPIPSQIAECKFLNTLNLSNNKLSGSITFEVRRMDRLKDFSVAGNDLSGTIPSDLAARFPQASFDGNSGLCGKPIGKCGLSGKSIRIIVAAGVAGALLGSIISGFLIWCCFKLRKSRS